MGTTILITNLGQIKEHPAVTIGITNVGVCSDFKHSALHQIHRNLTGKFSEIRHYSYTNR